MNQDNELWRTLKYAGEAQDKTSVETLMLRYRPIAPKPTTTSFASQTITMRRTKRKYVRVSKNNKATCRSKEVRSEEIDRDRKNYQELTGDIVTLQLLPEKSDLTSESSPLDLNNPTIETVTGGDPVRVESYVTVESVTGGLLSTTVGFTDEEVVEGLNKDTCPGFISDGLNRVVMVNEAYRRTITNSSSSPSLLLPEVIVWLVNDIETASFWDYRNFTCKVRLEYTWREMKYIKTVPCDVWKMEFGGFAWRLDTTAALTLWL